MREKIIAKLRLRSGETIGETLVALLIAALALMMMAGAIQSSYNAVERGRNMLDDYYERSETLATREGEGTGGGTVTIGDKPYDVRYYVNDKVGGTKIVAYK